jgi:carboxypeptidase family protein/TonB-dependent receptor-like protein
MKRTRSSAVRPLALVGLLALALGLALLPAAQAQTAGANLIGRVTDKNGAPLPGATITATQKETGFTRNTVSESDGNFRLPSLPIGPYTVVIELNGFATVTVEEVRLNVSTQREINVEMNPSTVEETITVTAEAPLLQTEPAIGAVVSEEQLENLPLNGRQFANLAVLAPGTQLAYNADPTKPGQLTVALNGGIGRNVNFLIDGGDNTDDTIGGALQNFNLEAVEEFNIQTQQYKAEYGRSTGGVLTVVTKTGTNDLSGAAWGFFRDDSLNSKTPREDQAGADKAPYERRQYGASLGGPIVKDRAHFFATYEKTKRDTFYSIDTVPGAGQPPVFPELQGASIAIPFEDELGTAKVTHNISPKQFLQVRYGYQKNADKYGASSLAAPDSLGTVSNKYSSILAGHSYQVGADSLNEFLFQYTKFENLISADSNNPTIYFPSGAHEGQNVNTPQSTNQTKYQYKDDFSFTKTLFGRANNLKAGANYIHEPTLGGDFSTGLNGTYAFLGDSRTSPVTSITFNGGFFGDSTPVDQYSAYFQDDLLFSDRLTLNVGLRYDYWTGFDLDQRSNPIWQTLSTQTRFNEFYLQDFQGGGGGKLSNDDNNWGPRLGFTYDLKGDGRQLLRGGYGIYYDFPYTNATILFPAAAVQSNFGVVYNHVNPNGIRNPDGSFFRPGQPLPPNQLPAAAIPPPNEVASPTLATPYSQQISLGYSWQVNNWLGINIEAVTIDYRDIPFRFRANPFVDANHNGTIDSNETRRFPDFGNFRIWYGGGKADYDGVNLSFRARATNKLEVLGFYTWSKAEGNVLAGADEFRITDRGAQPSLGVGNDVSVNPLNPLCSACIGPLFTDARHKLTLSGIYQGPWGLNFAGMFRYRSATPFTLHTSRDINGDGFRLDLPPDVSHVNSERGDSFSQFDLRLSKAFTLGPVGLELIAEMFNVFNKENPAAPTLDFNANGFPIGSHPTAFAGDPLQGEQRLTQLGLRVRF